MSPMTLPTDRPLVVFTDLDGTLIDHHTYDLEVSRAAGQRLHNQGVPLVFCSSKTFAEQRHVQSQLGIIQPFIFENGSAAAIPHGFFPENLFRAARHEQDYDIVVFAHADAIALRTALAHLPEVRGYGDASDTELSAATGLSGDALARARERWFTETLLTPLQEEEAVAIGHRLQSDGFILSRGGRFYTAQSEAVNKGRTVQWMMDIFRQAVSNDLYFAAVGDSLNDIPMLQVVDLPFLVQRPDQTWATMVDIPQLTRIEAVGPLGFSAVVSKLLVI